RSGQVRSGLDRSGLVGEQCRSRKLQAGVFFPCCFLPLSICGYSKKPNQIGSTNQPKPYLLEIGLLKIILASIPIAVH
ncbi:MAG TPA: hypothetical protein PK798_05075, partial [Flavobacteriales bacterium]|nr:hypothetical protein [Flavobacteriales bacterium]